MKRFLIKRVMVAGAAIMFTVTAAVAQDVTNKEKTKEKEKKDVQQIIITRSGNTNEKTVVEINGDKVIVNGKDVKENADGDVNVRINKIRDVTAYRAPAPPRAPRAYNFNFDDGADGFSLFSEDENRAMLGIMTDEDDKGAKITSVNKESPAEKAGLKVGDIITSMDGQKVEDHEDVAEAVRKHKPGEKTTITILRDGKEQKVTAELDKWKGIRMNADNFHFEMPEIPNVPHMRGYTFGPNTPKLGLSIQDTEDGKGVKVLEVDEDSNAAKAGLKEDDVITHVNDEAVNSADEISRKVRASRDKASLQFKVLRNGKTQSIDVKVPRKLKTTDL